MGKISITENRLLMEQARDSLKGKWGLAVGTNLVLILISLFGGIPFIGWIIGLIIAGPFALGWMMFVLNVSRKKEAKLSNLFQGFDDFGRAFCAYLFQLIFVLLWLLLLIVPGIIAAISYSQTYFILADNKAMGSLDAITKSKEMMKGNKWKYFCLQLRFLGWALLCIFSLGIGLLWLSPYVSVSCAKFYEDIREKELKDQEVNPQTQL